MMAPLENRASSVSPLAPQVEQKPAVAPCPAPAVDRKRSAKRLRHHLRRIVPKERVAACGQKALGGNPTLHRTAEGQNHFSGVETCGSVWMCAVCTEKITEGRRAELDTVLAAHGYEQGVAFLATHTIPHHRFQRCIDLRKAVSAAWRRVKQGKAWVFGPETNTVGLATSAPWR